MDTLVVARSHAMRFVAEFILSAVNVLEMTSESRDLSFALLPRACYTWDIHSQWQATNSHSPAKVSTPIAEFERQE
jgi:hypothetical protein